MWILIERHFGCGKKSTVYAVYICKTKQGHEWTFYWMDFDELSVVAKLAISAFKRRQNYHQPTNINSYHEHVFNFGHFHTKNASILTFFDRKKSAENDQDSKLTKKITKKITNWGFLGDIFVWTLTKTMNILSVLLKDMS